jgi:hypothetical protein
MNERSENERVERPDADRLAEQEAAAAAAEAASIGGPPPDDGLDPAERPVVEAGGGVAEGFEQAEEQLVEQATHGEPGAYPVDAAFPPEPEGDRSTAVYGEGDEIDPTEVVRDPREGDDDPGAGPGLAAER